MLTLNDWIKQYRKLPGEDSKAYYARLERVLRSDRVTPEAKEAARILICHC